MWSDLSALSTSVVRSDRVGQMSGSVDPHLFCAPGLAADQFDTGTWYLAVACEEVQKMLVGLSIYGRCGDADFQLVAIHADDFVPAGTWLHADRQNEVVVLPTVTGFRHVAGYNKTKKRGSIRYLAS